MPAKSVFPSELPLADAKVKSATYTFGRHDGSCNLHQLELLWEFDDLLSARASDCMGATAELTFI